MTAADLCVWSSTEVQLIIYSQFDVYATDADFMLHDMLGDPGPGI